MMKVQSQLLNSRETVDQKEKKIQIILGTRPYQRTNGWAACVINEIMFCSLNGLEPLIGNFKQIASRSKDYKTKYTFFPIQFKEFLWESNILASPVKNISETLTTMKDGILRSEPDTLAIYKTLILICDECGVKFSNKSRDIISNTIARGYWKNQFSFRLTPTVDNQWNGPNTSESRREGKEYGCYGRNGG